MIAPYRNPEAEQGFLRRPFRAARAYLSETLFERKSWSAGGSKVRGPMAWGFAAWVVFVSAFYVGAMLRWW